MNSSPCGEAFGSFDWHPSITHAMQTIDPKRMIQRTSLTNARGSGSFAGLAIAFDRIVRIPSLQTSNLVNIPLQEADHFASDSRDGVLPLRGIARHSDSVPSMWHKASE